MIPPTPFHYTSPMHGDVCTGILDSAGRGLLRLDFLSDVAQLIRDWCACDGVEVRMIERKKLWITEATEGSDRPRREVVSGRRGKSGRVLPSRRTDDELEDLCEDVIERRVDLSLPWFTARGSFWTRDTRETFPPDPGRPEKNGPLAEGSVRSLVIIPHELNEKDTVLVILKSREPHRFLPDQIESYEHVTGILAIATRQRRAQLALRERVKELTCLYGITRIAARSGVTLAEILQNAAELIPKGCLHENLASAKILFDGRSFTSDPFLGGSRVHMQEIAVGGKRRGVIELAYSTELPELDVGPFIKEELDLLEVVAGELSLVIEAREMQEKRNVLEDQLRHADRLATIGQLAAGVAHELNEPLVTILGRAQLSQKEPGLPPQAKSDYEKIVAASLHARDVIKKLKLFARRAPSRKEPSDVNEVVRDGLALLDQHLERAGITLETRLDPELPSIEADAGQLHQVLVNLVVNALQATAPGGRVVVRTLHDEDAIALVVEDTGSGMTPETLKQIFTPFFTTKDVDEGTGLGLAVVHGIVSAHGGVIRVKSEVGEGSRFEVRLPRVSRPVRSG